MRNDELKLRVLTEMSNANTDQLDKEDIRGKLETARFEELMYWERRKRSLLRLILDLLVAILLTLVLQTCAPYLATHLGKTPASVPERAGLELLPFLREGDIQP